MEGEHKVSAAYDCVATAASHIYASLHLTHLPAPRYAVFAVVEDDASFAVVDAIAAAVLGGAKPHVLSMQLA